jgi:hypothetical protein
MAFMYINILNTNDRSHQIRYVEMCSIQCTKRKENVTRSGEFSPFGRLFSLGRLSKITQLAQISGLLFSTVKIINFDKKMGWATSWAIFSQTHLVILVGISMEA